MLTPEQIQTVPVKDGATLIAEERRRQIDVERHTAEDDDHHIDGSLAITAAELAVDGTDVALHDPYGTPDFWGLVAKHGYYGTKPNRIRALTIAGALLAAEIDRLQRAERQRC